MALVGQENRLVVHQPAERDERPRAIFHRPCAARLQILKGQRANRRQRMANLDVSIERTASVFAAHQKSRARRRRHRGRQNPKSKSNGAGAMSGNT